MTFQRSNLIHASLSIILSLWMYFDAMNKDFGLLIPFLFGVVLLSLNNGIMYDNIAQRKAAFVITIISAIFVGFRAFQLLQDEIKEEVYYESLMVVTSFLSIFTFIWAYKSNKW